MTGLQVQALNYLTANGINPPSVCDARYELIEGFEVYPSPFQKLTDKEILEVLEELTITRQPLKAE